MDRRKFLKKGTIGTAALMYPFYTPVRSEERRISIGLIGSGWYGMVDVKAALKAGNVLIDAICDVDTQHLSESADELEKLQGKRPKSYKDYNDLLDHKGLEAVVIGTIPHWHALQFIAACEKGLDIYCEKPLSYDVKEGQVMVKAAEKAGNIVQIGFQRRQSKAFQKVKELIEGGMAGPIHQISAHIHYSPVILDTTVQLPPASLDWDTWCGPAPVLPYCPNIGHKAWRLEKEYGNGHLVDWGIHHIDIIRHIMGFTMPTEFNSIGGLKVLKGQITTPDTLTATMNFEGIPVVWEHRLWGTGTLNSAFNNGIYFFGEKATIFASDQKVILLPAGKNQEQQVMEIRTPDMQENHVLDFLNAVRKKDKNLISCRIEDAYQSTATVQLAMISYYSGSEVKWDVDKQVISGNSQAGKLLEREYRAPYKRPVV